MGKYRRLTAFLEQLEQTRVTLSMAEMEQVLVPACRLRCTATGPGGETAGRPTGALAGPQVQRWMRLSWEAM